MTHDTEKRKFLLQELADFIGSSQHIVEDTMKTLGWDKNKLNTVTYRSCPLNPEHQIPEESLAEHVESCKLKQEGYAIDADFLPTSDVDSDSCLILDEKMRTSIIHEALQKNPGMRTGCEGGCKSHPIPRTAEHVFSFTTPDERVALYDYVVENTKHKRTHDLPVDLPFPENSEGLKSGPKTLLEVLAQERDARRRRVSHKKVHTGRKSHTEILRQVIESQMEMLQSYVQTETKPLP